MVIAVNKAVRAITVSWPGAGFLQPRADEGYPARNPSRKGHLSFHRRGTRVAFGLSGGVHWRADVALAWALLWKAENRTFDSSSLCPNSQLRTCCKTWRRSIYRSSRTLEHHRRPEVTHGLPPLSLCVDDRRRRYATVHVSGLPRCSTHQPTNSPKRVGHEFLSCSSSS